ncbi:response regulator transcription factor [Spirosoma linguale]|uniref:Transcriptional regulator, LuxR family n=1 Tax=Spirosoma linguale (strain ATCC 33905 / DSM 74 / LMG 10896 / Claus 1) TaxID=504472 RepID=D2QML1_SPILD|nr:transcriptional regulator, LuxR family [Spirosoma linguale DSM 74]
MMQLPARLPVDGQYMTPRESEIVWLYAQGLSATQIAERLNVSSKTINRHCENIRARFGLRGYHALLQFALKIRPELEKWVNSPIKMGKLAY